MQKSYFNQIKMIYIDPPYNTGNDFIYKDNFKNGIKAYLEQTGQINGDGVLLTTNPETSGRFHSDWISMMYPRLFLAKNLMREDGVIFVSIDDHEFHNLRKIMDEIYGEENFIGVIKRRAARKTANLATNMSDMCDYIVIYSKNELGFPLSVSSVKDNTRPIFNENNKIAERLIPKETQAKCADGSYKAGKYKTKSIEFELLDDLEIKESKTINQVRIRGPFRVNQDMLNKTVYITSNFGLRRYVLEEEKEAAKVMSDLLDNKDFYNELGTEELEALFGVKKIFNNPKPSKLVAYLIKSVYSSYEIEEGPFIVLDFFAGSGTTAQAVIEANVQDDGKRIFILVQLPEKTDKESEAYKHNYKTIADISKERIRRVIKKLEKEEKDKLVSGKIDLGFKVFKLEKSNYKIWENYEGQDVKELLKQLDLFKSPLINDYKNMDVIYESIIKEGLNLNSEIGEMKIKTNKIYEVRDSFSGFYICLDEKISDKTLEELKLKKDDLLICLDKSLDDSKKVNLALQCKLKTI